MKPEQVKMTDEQMVTKRSTALRNGISKAEQQMLLTKGINLRGHSDFKKLFADKKILTPEEIERTEEKILDIRSRDCSRINLSIYTAEQISFDDQTVFPADPKMLPQGFDIKYLRNTFKAPGLNIHKLHECGIDGTGVAIAIIDQRLAPHTEYNDNLAYYEEIGYDICKADSCGSTHGSAVASIAVGKTVGVAPKSKLFYFAAGIKDGTKKRMSRFYAAALNKIIEINKTLPENEKIVVVSVSASPRISCDSELWATALQKAKTNGIFVTTTGIHKEYGLIDSGLNRNIMGDINNPLSYSKPIWLAEKTQEEQHTILAFPMDHRTTASPTGNNEYVHYASGGFSWVKPFEAGMYALAKQVDRTITPERFFELGLQTGTYNPQSQSVVINPVALIDKIKELSLVREKQQNIAIQSTQKE